MFEHSVRVPRHFKIAANIVQKVSQEGGSVKTLLYDNKLKHFRTNVLYALINETIKHTLDIENIFENIGIFLKEPRLDPWLAKVLTAELLYGKKTLPGKSKPEQTILSYKEQFEKLATEVQDDQKSKVVPRPRYVRINTNLLTTSDAIRAFQDEGYKFIRCTSGSYNDYLQQVQSLTEYDFTQDYHVKTIFVFYPRTKFHEHDLYLENKIILQDKATALAVHLLAPPVGSVVLDMCAAPGMKTTQLAAYLRNQGKIYAVERNEKRYETLCQYVEATGSKCVETFHKDSLEIKRGDMDDVEYILLDPSCTGSGMELSVHNYVEETRLAKLTSLQEKFLKHAMNSFPNAKRIVYSTCSIYPEENERVVTNIVKASRAKWRVKDVKELLKDQWNNFGSGMYGSMGTRCLYAKSNSDFTTGFFLAVLDRDFGDTNPQDDENKTSISHKNNNIIHRKEEQNKIKDNISNIDSNIFHNENSSEDINDVQRNKKLGRNKKDKDLHSENTNYYDKSNNAIEDKCDSPLDLKKKRKSKLAGEKTSDDYEDVSIDISIGTKENTDKKNRVKVDLEGTKTDNSVITTEGNEPLMEKKKKKKHKFSDKRDKDITEKPDLDLDKNSELNEIKNHTKVFIALESEAADKGKKKKLKKSNVIEISERENTSNISHEIDTELPNKRKKKDKMHVIENEEQVKNKKHSKDSLACESITVHQKKKKNMEICDDIETLESGQIIQDNNYSYKKKKKKHKIRNEDIEKSFPNTLPTLELNECIDETEKKSNNRKRYESVDCKITYESCTGSTDTKITEKHKKKKCKDSKDIGISDTNQLYEELPKKKKKKLESFES